MSILWGKLLEGSKVKLGRGGGAVADELTYQTDESDVFAGGDVYTGPKFAIDAIAAGKEALSTATSILGTASLSGAIGASSRSRRSAQKTNCSPSPRSLWRSARYLPSSMPI